MDDKNIDTLLKTYFKNDKIFFKRLSDLWIDLNKAEYPYQVGPYPVEHGREHIVKVLQNLDRIIQGYGGPKDFKVLTKTEKACLFAAGMIHDVGMIGMRPIGVGTKKSRKIRNDHARHATIEKETEEKLTKSGFSYVEAQEIIKIASTHAGDDLEGSATQKLNDLKGYASDYNKMYLYWSAILLQVADFFNIGEDRLTKDVEKHDWDPEQVGHYKIHKTIIGEIDHKSRKLVIRLSGKNEIILNGNTIKIDSIEQIKIHDAIYVKALEKKEILNELIGRTDTPWDIKVDEDLFGIRLPLGAETQSFKMYFEKALKEWKDRNNSGPFPMDIMGHSLFNRFVNDEEGLNQALEEAFTNPELHLRILILDPNIENQQMCEVFDAQITSTSPEERKRSILPLYSYDDIKKCKRIVDSEEGRGDILATIKEINDNWSRLVLKNSLLEVRSTTRMMYSGIFRYGDYLIVTPYRKKGLFKESQSWAYPIKSPFYHAHKDVFNDIWNSRSETTIRIIKLGKGINNYNPITNILPPINIQNSMKDILPLDYERFMLTNHLPRIKEIFKYVKNKENIKKSKDRLSTKFIPPFEVEIQPSEECSLQCVHCVGRFLRRAKSRTSVLKPANLMSLLDDFNGDGLKIERFRISGLFGDPLHDSVRHVTLDFIEKAKAKRREIVILTNGVGLEDESVLNTLVKLNKTDYVHISLDAASEETFMMLKGSEQFEKIKNHIYELYTRIKDKESGPNIGLGFVITQENAHEVVSAIKLAENIGVDFIRFKPDIRGMHALGWRNWREAEYKILAHPKSKQLKVVITDVGWTHYRTSAIERCWAQFFYTTLGANGKLYPCDHLTGNGDKVCLGDLTSQKTFKELWVTAHNESIISCKHRECTLCPPFGWRVNRFLSQLYAVYINSDWKHVVDWAKNAIELGNIHGNV